MQRKRTSRFTFHALVLSGILALFFTVASLYNAIVPLGEGPDEPGHLNYVLFLAREGRLPVQRSDTATSDVEGEGHQPPLAYLLAVPAVAWLPDEDLQIFLSANPDFLWNDGSEPAAFMRFSREYWPWRGVILAWHLARGVSALLGAVTVWCVWGAARSIAQHRHFPPSLTYVPLLAAALVAFNPQFLFTSALVTNDALLTTLSAGLLWLCVAWMGDGRQTDGRLTAPVGNGRWQPMRKPILAGLLLGLALLTKQSALLFIPLLFWASWCASQSNWRICARHVSIWASIALAIAGWWYIRNWQIYGDLFGYSAFRAKFLTQAFDWQSSAAWSAALGQLHASFWARFGWMSLRPPDWVIWTYSAIVLIAFVGLLQRVRPVSDIERVGYSSIQNPIAQLQLPITTPWSVVALLPLLAFIWTVSFALTAGLVAWQGRLLFPALPAIAILLATGLERWTALIAQPISRRPDDAVTPLRSCAAACVGVGRWSLLAGLIALAIYLPVSVIRPAYPWYTVAPQAAQERIETPVYARFAHSWERGVELRGGRFEDTAQAGTPITITLTWHALEHIPRDWTVFLHLLDDDGEIVAQDNTRPLGGAFPMTQWTPGDWVEDSHTIDLPADLSPGVYRLNVGLFRPDDRGQRLTIWEVDGTFFDDTVTIGRIVVQ